MVKVKIIIMICIITITNSITSAQLPDYFDWHNLDGKDWMSPVRYQGWCGSCWAHSSVGIVEALYNIHFDWPEYDIDLSEQHLVVNDVDPSCLSSGSCAGGGPITALQFIRDHGITDEACFPYVDEFCNPCECEHGCTNAECSDKCAEWADRLWQIDEYEYEIFFLGPEEIKDWIYNVGPVAAIMDLIRGGFDQYGAWICYGYNTDHAVIITGWGSDGGGDYWIIKNSWGTFWPQSQGGGGYCKVRFGECGIESAVIGASLTAEPDIDKFIVKNASGKTVAWFGDLGNIVLKGALEEESDFNPATGNNEFVVKRANGYKLAVIDTTNGNMYIRGKLYQEQPMLYPAGFKVINMYGGAYIDNSDDYLGYLVMTGKLYQNPTP